MTELSWLLDLLLNHKLSATVKKHVAGRITEIEANYSSSRPVSAGLTPPKVVINGAPQAASTIAAMQRHGTLTEPMSAQAVTTAQAVQTPTIDPGVLATTPLAAQAVASREAAIQAAMAGKPEKGRSSPNKFRNHLG